MVENSSYEKVIGFENEMQCKEFVRGFMEIKSMNDEIMAAYDCMDGMTEEEFLSKIHNWLNLSHDFTMKWHLGRIPQDIRSSIHSAQEILDLPLTDFGVDVGRHW